MTLSPHDCLFTEGALTLAAGYRDRTVNVFTAPGLRASTFRATGRKTAKACRTTSHASSR
ncbi:hypothetical protein [Pantoea sp. App145]|uniref:hypothetical protein n=1 Tax=Pantoea sp. App145 TaxID=3071567 RepID=UPI003A80584F